MGQCVWVVHNCFSGLWSIKIGCHLNQFTFIYLIPTVSNSSVYCWNLTKRSLNQSLRTYFSLIKTNGACCCCFVFQSSRRENGRSKPRNLVALRHSRSTGMRCTCHVYLCWLDLCCVKWSWSPHFVLIWVSQLHRHIRMHTLWLCSTSTRPGKGWSYWL